MERSELTLKGVVSCPICEKGFTFVYQDASGHASMTCHRCNRILLVDYGQMTAYPIQPVKRP